MEEITNSSLTGWVMQLQNFSVNDGEGIRTNIFLSGCPLCCAWCANPEGQSMDNPMTCQMRVEEIVKQIKRQKLFYRHSGGGVTFSGGEATLQQEFLRALTNCLYDAGVDLALETCGYFDFEQTRDILEKMELVFYDLKSMDREIHKQYTGVYPELIWENLKKVAALPCKLVIRIPVIQGVNASCENIRKTCEFVHRNAPNACMEFLPYHSYGIEKYRQLGRNLPPESFWAPTEEQLAEMELIAKEYEIVSVSYK